VILAAFAGAATGAGRLLVPPAEAVSGIAWAATPGLEAAAATRGIAGFALRVTDALAMSDSISRLLVSGSARSVGECAVLVRSVAAVDAVSDAAGAAGCATCVFGVTAVFDPAESLRAGSAGVLTCAPQPANKIAVTVTARKSIRRNAGLRPMRLDSSGKVACDQESSRIRQFATDQFRRPDWGFIILSSGEGDTPERRGGKLDDHKRMRPQPMLALPPKILGVKCKGECDDGDSLLLPKRL